MDIIFNNPFRILGLVVNATEREIAKTATDLKMFVELGKVPSIVTDFPCFPECCRANENIEGAKKRIEQAESRLFYSLFWFYNNDSVDELALEVLKEGRVEKAIELWERAFSKKTNLDNLEPEEEEIDYAIIENVLIPYLKENYSIKNVLSNKIKNQALIDSLKTFAEEVRINIIDEESWYLTSGEPIGEDDNGEEVELYNTEITKADYDKIVQNILQRKLVLAKKDFSHAKNLVVLYLSLVLNGEEINNNHLQKALGFAGRIFHSNNLLSQYSASIVAPNYKIEWEKVTKSFIDEVLKSVKPFYDDSGRLKEIAKCFDLFPVESRQYAIGKLIAQPIKAIENKLSEIAEKRKKNPLQANVYGSELYKSTYEDLQSLKDVLSASNLQYQRIADAVADEIVSCSVGYFNVHRGNKSKIDPGEDALNLAQYANSIAIGIRIQDRIHENIAVFEEWINDKPNRERQTKSEPHINYIIEQLKRLPDPNGASPHEINTARGFLANCIPSLNELRSILAVNSYVTPLIVVLERFENNENKWPESEDDSHLIKIDDGKYLLSNKEKEEARWSWAMNHLDFAKLIDFSLECGISKLNGSDDAAFGLVWAYQKVGDDTSYHKFFISGNGYYVFKEYHSAGTSGVNWKPSQHILKGNETNIFKINKRDNLITYHINNKLVGEEQLERLSGWSIGFYTNPNISIAINYLYFCDSYVSDVRLILDYDFYINLSSAVASKTLGFCIAYGNRSSDMTTALDLMKKIDTLNMDKELRERFNKNEQIMQNNISLSPQKQKTGCYIATMVYGTYNAPEVCVLRRFRDEVLSKYWFGPALAEIYYRLSPILVKKVSHIRLIHRVFKIFLDGVVKCLK